MLRVSYNMEIETVINYTANAVHLDGIHATTVKNSLAGEVNEELLHAQTLAKRLKVLDAGIPGSLGLRMEQHALQPPADPLDLKQVLRGVIEAEQAAIDQYRKIIEACEGVDPVTQDVCVGLMGDEQEHHRLFKGYLAEAERMGV